MAFKPTLMQEKAIVTNGNILVSAAAGSGKTAVLVERVISKIIDKQNPISADKFLIVTFTNAASIEMRTRIEKRLYEECLKAPDDVYLIKQRHLLANADICTIDSFCINLVRQNFEKCGADPDFKIADAMSLTSASSRALAKVSEKFMKLDNPDVVQLLDLVGCEYNDGELKRLIVDIYNYSRNMPFSDEFIENLKSPYEAPFNEDHVWYNGGFNIADECICEMKKCLEKMADNARLMERQTDSDKCDNYTKNLAFITESFHNEISGKDWDKFYNVLHSTVLGKSPSSSTSDPAALSYKSAMRTYFDSYDKLMGVFCKNSAEVRKESESFLNSVRILIEMVKEYGASLTEIFKSENFYTFAEIEQMAFSLLCKESDGNIEINETAEDLINRYDEVMVDEFQDVNDLQNALFYVLSDKERKLFVVGDVKQSIYGFRGSNPENFLNKKYAYLPIEEAGEHDAKKIVLSDNFRSRKGICDYVNYFFYLCMSGQLGRLVYNEEEMLNAKKEFPATENNEVELIFLDKTDGEKGISTIEYEARAIARYIKKSMEGAAFISEKDGKGLRKANYGDFVILLDRLKDKADVISKTLTESGIPVAAISESYAESYEISLMLSLLQIIDNPRCDVELLTVMMSPMYSFSAEELAKMRCGERYGDLYKAVLKSAQSGDKHSEHFINSLADMRELAAVLSLQELIVNLIAKTDILNIVSAMPSGELKRSNLLSLSKYSADYSSAISGSISGFVRYIRELPQNSFKEAASVSEQSVRIMTMHASKGLQFPVCIIANLSGRINRDDALAKVLYKSDAGVVFKYYDPKTDSYIHSLGHTVASDRAYETIIDEKLRLLYVAMTRAEEKLVMISCCNNLENKLNKICESLDEKAISSTLLKSATTMNDLVVATSLLHTDCKNLRALCGFPLMFDGFKDTVDTEIINCAKLQKCESVCTNVDIAYDENLLKNIKNNMEYVYPFASLKSVKAKASVSLLAHSGEGNDFDFTEKPAFMFKEGISPAGKGTAMHHIMQFINMDGIPDVESEIERLLEWQYITPSQAAVCDKKAIKGFFESDVYKRILKSTDVRRELRFMTEIAADEIKPELSKEIAQTPVVVQGAVDLCFEEDGEIVVLDFKTDRVTKDSQLISAYKEQLEIYADACQKIFSKPVKQKIIYSFALQKEIVL